MSIFNIFKRNKSKAIFDIVEDLDVYPCKNDAALTPFQELRKRVIQSEALCAIKRIDELKDGLLIKCKLSETFYLRLIITDEKVVLGSYLEEGENPSYDYFYPREQFIPALADYIIEVSNALRSLETCAISSYY